MDGLVCIARTDQLEAKLRDQCLAILWKCRLMAERGEDPGYVVPLLALRAICDAELTEGERELTQWAAGWAQLQADRPASRDP